MSHLHLPWKAIGDDGGGEFWSWRVEDARGSVIFFGMEQDIARLFSAAPDMLAALNVARERLGEGPIDVMRSTLAQIDHAISKAS